MVTLLHPYDLTSLRPDIWEYCADKMTEVTYTAPLVVMDHSWDIHEPRTAQDSIRIHTHSSPPGAILGAFQDSTTSRYLRAGGRKLCETPYNYRRLPSEHIPFDDVEHILRKHNICFLITSPSLVECTPGYDDLAEPIQALQVLARCQETDSQESWLKATQEIHTLLRSHGLDNLTIEILDWRLPHGPDIYPCKSSDAIFPKWDAVRKQILQRVDVPGFHFLGCYRIGYDFGEEDSTPSVLVTVDPKHGRDWSIVEHDIRNILTEFDLGMVDVRIFKDRDIFCARRSVAETQISSSLPTVEEEIPTAVTIGNGVGAHNSKIYGTFGGWLNLQQNPGSEWQQFGLTCRHCVFDHVFSDLHIFKEKEKALRYVEDQQENPSNETRNITELPSRQKVDSPSVSRVQYFIDYYRDMVNEKRRAKSFRLLKEIQAEGDLPEDLAQKLGCLKKGLGELENHLGELEAYKRTGSYEFGEVWADSGDDSRRTTAIMDWALVKPHPNRALPSNKFAPFSSLGERAPMPRMGHIKAGVVLSNEQEVFKQAARSGELRTTDEHSVVYDLMQNFFKPGDSGALIYNKRGCIAGMAFGGQMSGRIVVFTHMDNLIADIKGRTGAERVVFYGQEELVDEYDVD